MSSYLLAWGNFNLFKHLRQHCFSLLRFFARLADEVVRDGDLEVCLHKHF